jgi:hypothetical protein
VHKVLETDIRWEEAAVVLPGWAMLPVMTQCLSFYSVTPNKPTNKVLLTDKVMEAWRIQWH